jgi:proteic killer suppression protein
MLRDILARLDAAATVSDMNLPGFRLHPLKGSRKGFWAVTVRANWRVVFRFTDGEARDVDYVDYH